MFFEGRYGSAETSKAGRPRAAREASALESVGLLPEHAKRYPHEFSAASRQRIGIARALALNVWTIRGVSPSRRTG